MTWQPGQPVVSDEDHREWAEWRIYAKRQSQRARRRLLRRIDWETSPEMREFLARLQLRHGCIPIGHLLEGIVRSWAPMYLDGQVELEL